MPFPIVRAILSHLSPRERRFFAVGIATLLLSGIALMMLLVQTKTSVVPTEGGVFREGAIGQPTYVNPVLASSEIDKSLVRLLFSSLPSLAETIERDESGRVVKVRLKDNLYWSNGERLTSDDVIFTVKQMQDPDTRSPLFATWQGVTANRGSQLEVIFNLVSPYAFFMDNLAGLYVLPKHLFAEVPAANWRLSDYNLRPVGSGPYAFKEYEKRDDGFVLAYRLTQNPYYAGEAALIPQIEFLFVSREEDLLRNFMTGRTDAFLNIEPSLVERITRPHTVHALPSPTVYAAFLNQSQNLALQSKEVRTALSLVAPRERLVQEVLRGYGSPTAGPLPPALPLAPISIASSSASREEAIALLEKNGWRPNESGVREKSVKNAVVKLSFELTVPDVLFLKTTAQVLSDEWRGLGAEVTVAIAPLGDEVNTIIRNRDYQAILFGNSVRESGDLFPFWHSSERFHPGLNLALYQNKTADGLIERIRQNVNPEERQAQLEALQELIVNDTPAIFLYSPSYLYVTSKNVYGIQDEFLNDVSDRFMNANQWFLKTARVLK